LPSRVGTAIAYPLPQRASKPWLQQPREDQAWQGIAQSPTWGRRSWKSRISTTATAKKGIYGIEWGKEWVKSPSLTTGQCPVMKYNRQLMMAILWGRMDYLGQVMNVEVIPLEKALEAYRVFDEGSPKKFVIDPHGSVRRKDLVPFERRVRGKLVLRIARFSPIVGRVSTLRP
jgi:hypothetical protein